MSGRAPTIMRTMPRAHAWRLIGLPCQFKRALSTSRRACGKTDTIAVLGGGVSGLAAAIRLSRALPSGKKVVVIEKEDRLGGWIQSERRRLVPPHDAPHGAKEESALLEGGPRSIRPTGYSGLVMLDLVRSLGLWDRMLLVPKTAPSARNRFIWYPDRLNQLPSSLAGLPSLFRLPVMKGVVRELLREFNAPSRFLRPKSESAGEKARWAQRELLEDESIESFMARRCRVKESRLVRNIVSAVIHGIYAGDTRRLSVRAILPFLWEAERVHGGLQRRFWLPPRLNKRYRASSAEQVQLKEEAQAALERAEHQLGKETVEQMKKISVYSFPEGVAELPRAMGEALEQAGNVELRRGVSCSGLHVTDEGTVQIETSGGTVECDRVISSLPGSTLASLLSPALPEQYLAGGDAANVGVVNIAIPSWLLGERKRLLPVKGFGFLVPRGAPDNDAGILGVVFDSDALPSQDVPAGQNAADARVPTKLTVMMGGAHWQGVAPSELPSDAEMVERAKAAVAGCLGVPRALLDHRDTLVVPRMQRDCIPWYTVGHPVRMARLHRAILGGAPRGAPAQGGEAGPWRGKLALVGASYTGVSLNDCVARAFETAQRIVDEEAGAQLGAPTTGLELPALQCGML